MYENSILAANSYLENSDSIKAVSDEIGRVYLFNNIKDLTEEQRTSLTTFYEEALKNISKLTVIQKYQWQQEIVINIVHMINQGLNEIMVAIETGHGKTLIIQLISDILLRMT